VSWLHLLGIGQGLVSSMKAAIVKSSYDWFGMMPGYDIKVLCILLKSSG
jgi:hypothetical protein